MGPPGGIPGGIPGGGIPGGPIGLGRIGRGAGGGPIPGVAGPSGWPNCGRSIAILCPFYELKYRRRSDSSRWFRSA